MENRSILFILLLIHTASPLFQELCTRLFVFQTNFLLECVELLCKTRGIFWEAAGGIRELGFPEGLNFGHVNKPGL